MEIHEHTYAVHPLTTVHRVIGEVKCGECAWAALMTGDDEEEIHDFLITQLAAHIDQHRQPK